MKKSSKTFKCSDNSVNVYGMTVKTSGIKLTDFMLNPVCLLNHNYDKVLGKWTDVQLVGDVLLAVPMIDTEDEEANRIGGQIEREVIKGASIGIIPLSVSGNEIVESQLLEISITPVPANRNALVIYDANGSQLNVDQVKNYVLSISNTPPITKKSSSHVQQPFDEKTNWGFDDYAQKSPLELSAMQAQNPLRYNKLVADKIAAVRSTGLIAD